MTFAPKTWVVGEVVSAAVMNQEIRDQFNSFIGAWTPYTPTWTAVTTNPALGNGTLVGRYMKVGRTVLVEILLTTGSTTTYGSGNYSVGLPAAAATGMEILGTARLSAGSTYIGQCSAGPGASAVSATFPASASPANAANMNSSTPATLAAGHILRLSVFYEAAS